MRGHDFLTVMRCPFEIVCFLLHNFRTRYPDEISRYKLCIRFHNTCLFVMRYLDEMTCFLAAEFSFLMV
jgi:hypothetical protein